MKTDKLEIPRPQFDRIADAFEHQVFDVNEFDFDKDTIIFTIKEPQRVWFEKYAVQKIIKWKGKLKKNPYRWICQIFLPREIEKYLVK
jgi:hypothetical protein